MCTLCIPDTDFKSSGLYSNEPTDLAVICSFFSICKQQSGTISLCVCVCVCSTNAEAGLNDRFAMCLFEAISRELRIKRVELAWDKMRREIWGEERWLEGERNNSILLFVFLFIKAASLLSKGTAGVIAIWCQHGDTCEHPSGYISITIPSKSFGAFFLDRQILFQIDINANDQHRNAKKQKRKTKKNFAIGKWITKKSRKRTGAWSTAGIARSRCQVESWWSSASSPAAQGRPAAGVWVETLLKLNQSAKRSVCQFVD